MVIGLLFTTTSTLQAQSQNQEQEGAQAAVLTGEVVDAETGEPITGVKVKLKGEEKANQTNEEGEFGFAGLDKGTYTVKVNAEGYKKKTKEIEVASSAKELTIKLQPSSSSTK